MVPCLSNPSRMEKSAVSTPASAWGFCPRSRKRLRIDRRLPGLLLLALGCAPAPESSQAPAVPRQPGKPDVAFVTTPDVIVNRMLELAEIQPGDVVYDLGCGDGRIVVAAAKKYGVKGVGFEI